MAALDFPSSPVLNQVYSVGEKSWTWNGASWVGLTPIIGYGTVASGSINGGSASSPEAIVKIASTAQYPKYAPTNNPGFTGTVGLNGQQVTTYTTVAASDIDCSKSNYYYKAVSGNTTFTVSNVPTSNSGNPPVYSFTLEIAYTSGTITWFSGVLWAGGSAPVLAATKTSLLMFVTRDGGTTWYGSYLTNFA